MRICSHDECEKPAIARGMCSTHWMAWRRATPDFTSLYGKSLEERFWSKVDKRGPDECWPWKGTLEKTGYGQLFTNGANGYPRIAKAHRVGYELLVGPVPEGLDLDHTCHDPSECNLGDDCPHRRCCNPAHLEPVTERVNCLRSGSSAAEYAKRTHCANGHPLSGDNLILRANGARRCRTCKNARERAYYAARQDRN